MRKSRYIGETLEEDNPDATLLLIEEGAARDYTRDTKVMI